MTPPAAARWSLVHRAISSASSGSPARMLAAVRQPTIIRRENTSVTNAVNAIPAQVGTYVKSTTHSRFGAAAVKSAAPGPAAAPQPGQPG